MHQSLFPLQIYQEIYFFKVLKNPMKDSLRLRLKSSHYHTMSLNNDAANAVFPPSLE